MKYVFLLIPVLFLGFLYLLPAIALANMHRIETTPPQRCGLHCVIETVGFDTKDEADYFWKSYQEHDGVGGRAPYQSSNDKHWYVDYQVEDA